MELRHNASEKEQAFIEALSKRYSKDPMAERAPYDQAYADAMANVYATYPNDPDAATFYGAALMNLSPCNSREASNVLLGMISHESSSSMKGIARARAIMAASCLAEEPDISLELGKKILNKVIDSLEESDVFDFKANTSLDKVADELIHSEVWKNEFANCVKYRFTESTGMPRRKIGMLYLYIKHYLKSENILESIDAAYISSDDNHIIDILFELSHVYDLLGRRVSVLSEGIKQPGEHRETWNASTLPAGVYLVQLSTEDGLRTTRGIVKVE